MRHVTAREIMSSPVVTARPETSVRQIVELMLRSRISGLPVVDDDQRVLGVVTEADLLEKEDRPSPQPPLLSWHSRSLRLERMLGRYRNINRILIVRAGRLAGIVTRAD